jgi:hypothetical protein
MALQIGDTAPDFEAETTEGPIRFHDWVGDGWARPNLAFSTRLPTRRRMILLAQTCAVVSVLAHRNGL